MSASSRPGAETADAKSGAAIFVPASDTDEISAAETGAAIAIAELANVKKIDARIMVSPLI